MKEALKQILDLLQPVAALAEGTPFEHSEVIQRCVDASEIALEALAQDVQYTGNGTAGREEDVRPTGFFFQTPKPEQKQEPISFGIRGGMAHDIGIKND
jgi:hypothetical protein